MRKDEWFRAFASRSTDICVAVAAPARVLLDCLIPSGLSSTIVVVLFVIATII